MSWFKEHLHLSWLFYMIVTLFIDGAIMFFASGLNASTSGRITSYIWLMLTPFPVNIWILRQKNRSWAWSLFTLWTLCWIPLVLRNKSGEAKPVEQIIEIARGIKIVKEVKPNESDLAQSRISGSGHSDGCSETHTHSDKTGDI